MISGGAQVSSQITTAVDDVRRCRSVISECTFSVVHEVTRPLWPDGTRSGIGLSERERQAVIVAQCDGASISDVVWFKDMC